MNIFVNEKFPSPEKVLYGWIIQPSVSLFLLNYGAPAFTSSQVKPDVAKIPGSVLENSRFKGMNPLSSLLMQHRGNTAPF